MRRADRLFQIVQLLRRDRVSTAAKLAREPGVSERTLYRDIADLMASGVPIESEAGVGYSLPRHFDLPPGRKTSLSDLPFLVPDFHVPPETARFLGELREALRTFRVDRIQSKELLGLFETVAGRGLEDYLGKIRTEKHPT